MFKKAMAAAVLCALATSASASRLPEGKAAEIAKAHGLSPERSKALARALAKARFATQGGSSAIHPATREQCQARSLSPGLLKGGESDVAECGYPNMAVVPGAGGSKVCVDRFEFPNIPCDYPVTWVQASEASEICRAEGKRLCDAHEWEASCSGDAQPEDWRHPGNAARKRTWAYGDSRQPGLCAFGQPKSPGCDAAIASNKNVAEACGPNTWPAGSFPQCAGELGVYDLHGNAAEHMSLARSKGESGAAGGSGVTEMKGSWFVFPKSSAKPVHEDDCLWRAPGWHRTDVASPRSHANYHLGFRCCADAK